MKTLNAQCFTESWVSLAGIALAFSVAFICQIVYYQRQRAKYFRASRCSKPVPPRRVHFSHFAPLPTKQNEAMPALMESFEHLKPIVQANVTGLPYLFITDLEELSNILRKDEEFLTHEVLRPWPEPGPLSDSRVHLSHRWYNHSLLEMITNSLSTANEQAFLLTEQIQSMYEKSPVNIYPKIYRCVLDITCELGMGTSVNAQIGGNPEYVASVLGFNRLVHKRQMLSWLLRPSVFNLTPAGRGQNKLLKKIFEFSEEMVVRRIILLEQKRKNRPFFICKDNSITCYLDLLLRDDKLSLKEIQEELNDFILSNHAKTSATITWALFELGCNPKIQEAAYLEQKDIFQGSFRAVTRNDLGQMTYLDRVIKETLRLYPNTPIISKRLKNDLTIRGHEIPAGTDIPIFVYYINRNAELFPDPEEFNPDRFLPDQITNLPRDLPLFFGPKYSLDEKLAVTQQKIILSHLLRHFKFTSLDDRSDLKLSGDFVLRPQNNLRISFKPRLEHLRPLIDY